MLKIAQKNIKKSNLFKCADNSVKYFNKEYLLGDMKEITKHHS